MTTTGLPRRSGVDGGSLPTLAFKFTPTGGLVVLRAHTIGDARLLIEVEDECGIPDSEGDPFQSQAARTRLDGLGLGLWNARKAVRAHGGDIHIRNIPGNGWVFVIDVPLAAEEVPAAPGVAQ
jgi:signal transduction histidine kinase